MCIRDSFNAGKFWNAVLYTIKSCVEEPANVILSRDVHPLKESLYTLSTFSGIVIDFNEAQFWNAPMDISFMLLGKVIFSKL